MIGLPQLRGNFRLGVWSLLCLLTLLIFLYPTDLELRYAAVESIYVFPNLPLFGALYYAWFALILVLLFFPGGNQGSRDWENIALVLIFTLCFSGIWVHLSQGYYHCDTWSYAGRIKNSLLKGYLDDFPGGGPVEFPVLVLLGCDISQIMGLEIFDTIMVILLFQIALFSILLYVLFKNLLKDGRLASLATLILASSNLICDFLPQFHPRIFVMLFLVACLVLLTDDKPAMYKSWKPTLLFIILLAALTITHLVNSYVLFFILVGMYLVQRLSKSKIVSLLLVMLTFVGIEAYGMYSPSLNAHAMGHLRLMWETILYGKFIDPFSAVGINNNIGPGMPLWANVIIMFWLLLVALGGILGFRNLLRIRRVSSAGQKEVGGLVGTAIFAIIGYLAQGMAETAWRISFFLIPFTTAVVLSFLSTLRARAQRLAFAVFIMLIFILSFPTFLAHNDNVGMNIFLPSETSSTKFLGDHYGEFDRPRIITPIAPVWMTPYYIPNVQRTTFPAINNPLQPYPDLNDLYGQLDEYMEQFKSVYVGKEDISLFMLSPRYTYEVEYIVGLDMHLDLTTDPHWLKALSELAQENMIYNNGVFQIYHAAFR